MTRIRTLDFLPEIFQTPTNAQFLSATLDQLVNPPVTEKIQGYIGSKFGNGINAKDFYVTEPNKTRTNYQLDPGVVFTKTNESVANDFISYPGIVDALNEQNAPVQNNSELFESQFYSWDSFTNLDKIINFNEYYWLPEGPPAVEISASPVFKTETYIVTNNPNSYDIRTFIEGSENPTLTLIRGGRYEFVVDQNSQFWIQGVPGLTGISSVPPYINTREVFGVSNNGASQGIITFDVPQKNAQDEYNFPGNNLVDVVCTIPFSQINGATLSTVNNIDGITSLNGLRVLFYNTGIENEIGYVQTFYSETNYDVNSDVIVAPITTEIASINGTDLTLKTGYDTEDLTVGQTISFSNPVLGGIIAGQVYYVESIIDEYSFTLSTTLGGSPITFANDSGNMVGFINQGLLEEGYYTTVNANFYRIEYVGDLTNPVIRLVNDGLIPTNQKITATYGKQYIARNFYKNYLGFINIIPYLSAPLNTLYYQDGTIANKVGIINLIENNVLNTIDVENDILGQTNYISPNGVTFTNGLKVIFDGDVIPVSYLQGEYYVEGVGSSISLVPAIKLLCPEAYTSSKFIPYDSTPYDIGNFDNNLFIPETPDYITIARNALNLNAWSRSNRWFHVDVINATATYNNNPFIVTSYATYENKAKRPILEFYPNLKLFDSGTISKSPVDFLDFRTTNAFTQVAGQTSYYPDVAAYTTDTASITGTGSPATTTTLTIDIDQVSGTLAVGQYIQDSNGTLPTNTTIKTIVATTTQYTLTVEWEDNETITGVTDVSFITGTGTINSYGVFPGAKIVFSNDIDESVRRKVYTVEFSTVISTDPPVITLVEAGDSNLQYDDHIIVLRGYNNQGKSFYYDGIIWNEAQQKISVNQAPLFDIFDSAGISFGNATKYTGTSFVGNKLFSYGIGSGLDDSILGFPIRYSSVDNVGDISFDVNLNIDSFTYVDAVNPITQKVNTGYVHDYTTRTNYNRELGWVTSIGPSVQYQLFSFDYLADTPTNLFTCDIPILSTSPWPTVQVYVNNIWQSPNNYFVTTNSKSTTINLSINEPLDTIVQILLLSDETSNKAYYTIPINLSNNPFNANIETANIGDIRSHYKSIFINTPNISGPIYGNNNFRDLGNLLPYGTAIIQNSASLALPGTFLRKQNQNLFDALLFNSREYINYKQLIVDTVNSLNLSQSFTPSNVLDSALEVITKTKNNSQSFFWSDMVPGKASYITNNYTFNNDFDVSVYPLSKIYNFDTANYNGVLVYLSRIIQGVVVQRQLLRNIDYVISTTSPSLTLNISLQTNDVVTIKEYNQTYGSYAPNTPTKLGLYPSFIPEIILDSNYITPTYFIRGHDGSYTKLYGEYNQTLNTLIDYRDQALFEFENRVYNNLKLSTSVPIAPNQIIPGYFRTGDLSYNQFLDVYSINFLNWIGQNRLDYKTQYYINNNQYTYNYSNSANKLSKEVIDQGAYRGVYLYYYDTAEPNLYPWEMLGLTEKPSWWESRYGPAPYTSENIILWSDLEQGINYNNGNPIVIPEAVRPGLTQIIPVDTAGNLLSPLLSIVGNYDKNLFQRNWKVGDVGPVEYSYRKSSTWPFDLMKIIALSKPAQFFNLGADLDNYKYNTEFNQYLVNNRSHLIINDIEIYGNGTAKTSYINWIVDYEKQLGINATDRITTLLDNLDVRLVYRLSGFSDKTLLKFYVEKGSPNSTNASLLIPDESYNVLLYDNQPYNKIIFSGVVVQKTDTGYVVYGNSQETAYFVTLNPLYDGNYDNITVEQLSVKITNNYSVTKTIVPYGTQFYTPQEVSQFLTSYGAYLTSSGMIFNTMENGVEINWRQMVGEFLYWAQTGWETGSIITLNPAANELRVDKPNSIVQPLTLQRTNFILNQNLYPISLNNLSIVRDNTAFICTALNNGDSLAYAQFNFSNFEHGIVFNNITLFDDIIYNLTTGLRQNRITVKGVKSGEWNGTVNASGFILNQDNIEEWNREYFYTKGVIVKYKNKYWTALKKIEPAPTFNESFWKETEYDEIQKGLLPNSSTRSYESTLYYDINQTNLEQDADVLGFSLIGYRPRDYLALVDLTDITQVNVYKNLIQEKGTKNSLLAFKGTNLPQGGIDYDVYENWAIKIGEFGGVLNDNFLEFRLNENVLTGNPSIASLTNGIYTTGSQQEVPLYSLFNYGRPVETTEVLPTLPTYTPVKTFPTAGFVNFNDVKMSSYFYSTLANAVDEAGVIVPITNFYVRDYVWLANYLQDWQVYSWVSLGEVVAVIPNLNNTCTIRFAKPHNLSKFSPLSIVNFQPIVDGYYIISDVVDLYDVIIPLNIANNTPVITGRGIGLTFVSQRVQTPSDIINLPLINAEFVKNTVWVENDYDGNWGVIRKSINYQYDNNFLGTQGSKYGASVAYTENSGYLVGHPNYTNSVGKVYSYRYNSFIGDYEIFQTLTGTNSYGTSIAYANKTYVISQPTSTPKVFIYTITNTKINNQLVLTQEIAKPTGAITNWGSTVDISGDTNWLYISDIDNDVGNYRQNVYVYRKQNIPLIAGYFTIGQTYIITSIGTTDFTSIGAFGNEVGITFIATGIGTGTGTATQITYKYVTTIDGSAFGDDFGKSIATDFDGNTLVIGAPSYDYSVQIENYGETHVYQRTVQNIEVQYNSNQGSVQTFPLGWTPTTITKTATNFNGTTNFITLNNVTNLTVGDAIVFSGSQLLGTNLTINQTYYIINIVGSTIQVSTSRSSSTPFDIATQTSVSVVATIQTPLYVQVNGTSVTDNYYNVIGTTFNFNNALKAGDIINVSGNEFNRVQSMSSQFTPRIGVQFGNSVDITRQASEIIIGAPFELDDSNVEGAVYRFTNAGAKYGTVLGTEECNITTQRKLFINGFLINLPIGNAETISKAINAIGIPNVQASYSVTNNLYISLINIDLGIVNEKLMIAVTDEDTLTELGISLYTQTQLIQSPHTDASTQFGYTVKFNEQGSFVVSARVGTRYEATTFDFTDDENLDNDTIFDNNATSFIDNYPNAGAVYMFDYLPSFNETISAPGNYIYAQSTNSRAQVYGSLPLYGEALDFNQNHVIIGSPDFYYGEIVTYVNNVGVQNWYPYRKSSEIVNIEKIENAQIFSATTNNTLVNLDYFDPLQGKLLGAVQQNLDFITNVDPAKYNSTDSEDIGILWGEEYVGRIWFDTTNVRFVNYHQNDVVYNSQYWGELFPGSDVAVYTWVESIVLPSQYIGPGTVLDPTLYSTQIILDSTNTLVPIYYFWVRNTGIVNKKIGKTLADTIIERYISNPILSGISYFAPLLPNTFGYYNVGLFLNGVDSVFHIGYSVGSSADIGHTEFTLIRSNYPDDFLPGLPNLNTTDLPSSLYDRFLDSMAGVDEAGAVVPNPFLPRAVQSGVQVRPRQSFFYDRLEAIKNYIIYANTILKQFPITEIRESAFAYLLTKNPANDEFGEGEEYNTANYWEYVNYWLPGYDDNTKSAFTVQYYADLSTLSVEEGTIVTVGLNANGSQETYIYNNDQTWTRIGLENGTIQFKDSLYNYASAKLGFGDNFYDTNQYDQFPSTETRYIIRALNEQIYIDELLIFRNKSLILLFDYIQTETTESQNFLPWLSKTSLIDVSHTIRELLPLEVFRTDNQDFLAGYLNEVKPYHVVIKDFLFKYTGIDVFEGDLTDFDLPSQYNSTVQKFISPQLVYTEPTTDYQYTPTSDIWQTRPYNQWFLNKGISIGNAVVVDGETTTVGEPNYVITTLLSYVTFGSSVIFLQNASGLPINGVIKIDEEYIGYSFIDRSLNYIGNLQRGLFETTITDHIPGDLIIIDLPPVIIYDGGRAYTEPPKITAYIDPLLYPEPSRPAQLEAIMSLDRVVGINVIDPGQGYMVQPEIIIEPASELSFASTDVDVVLDIVTLYAPNLVTGDLIQYKVDEGSTSIGGLVNGQWYYINLLQSNPNYIIAFYTTYGDAINDRDRVNLYTVGTGTFKIALGAKAYAITSAQPIRENIITLRYDRTTYTSQVIDWEAGAYYGGFFAGSYSNSERVASSGIQLQSTEPDIATILAGAQGAVFDLVSVANDRTVTFSSFIREVYEILGNDPDPAESYIIRLQPLDGIGDPFNYEPNAPGLTLGFYVGMPIKFNGDVGGNIEADTIYYVEQILNPTDFRISATENGPVYALTDFTSIGKMSCFVGEVTDKAVVTINYPDILTVTATNGTNNKLTVPLSPIGTGGTLGFYTNVPVEFVGDVFGNIVENQIYYITSVCDQQTFTISKTQDPLTVVATQTNSSNNSLTVESTIGYSLNDMVILSDIVISSGQFIIGETYTITNLGDTDFTALGATENLKGLNFIATGSGSFLAENFIAGLSYVITNLGDTDWNLLANTDSVTYIVGDIILALNPNTAIGTTGTGAQGLGKALAKSFGNLNAGQTYYVLSIPNLTSLVLSSVINGNEVTLVDQEGTANLVNQKDTLQLATATGTMTMNVGLPVSPGQIDGQQFTFYETSEQIVDPVLGADENLIVKVVAATLGDGTSNGENKLAIKNSFTGLSNFYVNMPMVLDNNIGAASFTAAFIGTIMIVNAVSSGKIYIGGTIAGGTIPANTLVVNQLTSDEPDGAMNLTGSYTVSNSHAAAYLAYTLTATLTNSIVYRVIEYTGRYNPETEELTPKLQTTCSSTSSNIITCDSTGQLYVGMPIIFSGQGLGGVTIGNEYFVKTIVSSTTFTISEELNGPVFTITVDNGVMIGTGDAYIQIADPLVDYDPVILSTVVEDVDITQTPQSSPSFDISYILGGYRAIITNPGSGYAVNNTITIAGIRLNGTTPTNNLTLTVNDVDTNGGITSVICDGIVPGTSNQYYLKVISPTQLEVYSNPLMTIPVSGINFSYQGFTQTTATAITSSNDRITVTSSANFSVGDAVVFTGTIFSTEINLGQTYYIYDKPTTTTVRLTIVPSGTVINFSSNASGSMTMAKAGSFILLPEPFYFTQSIVKYNNRAYICIVSNNDSEFIFGKWQELDSGDRRLNALDRVISYYQPTTDMPGVDITQLFAGVTYPNSTYLGNKFAPAQQYPLDTVLQDLPFYPTSVNVTSILYDGSKYIAASNVPNDYTAILLSENGVDYEIVKLTNTSINATDIIKGEYYVMTSQNTATPVFRSNDGINWTTNGYYTPYGALPYDDNPYDMTALSIAALSLNSVTYNNGIYVAVGSEIVTSSDTYIWRNTFTFPTVEWNNAVLTNTLYGVTYVAIPLFSGFVAVGKGQRLDYSTGLTQTLDTSLILISQNGYNWLQTPSFSDKGFYAVISDNNKIIAAGEEGILYYSENGTDWYGINQTNVISIITTNDIINVSSTIGLSVNDIIKFDKSFSTVIANTQYYVHTVVSSTQLIISASLGGSPYALTIGSVASNTYLRKLPITANINDLIFENNVYIAVGNDGLILTSNNGINWTTQTSGVNQDLLGITFKPEVVDPYTPNTFKVVGKNNTIIESIDNGVTWEPTLLFEAVPAPYTVQGDPFTQGYGPEELVPGVIEDNLTMLVTTRPGTNWPAYQYGHVGYGVLSLEIQPISGTQVIYSFANKLQYPAQLAVFVIDGTTNLSTSLYETVDYTINWNESYITLNNPISYLPVTDTLRIDLYEIGNGEQLVKSSTKSDPIITNSITGFNEIFLNCNYSENIYNGSGIIRPTQVPVDVTATRTKSIGDSIFVADSSKFIINGTIYFQGAVFGNVTEDTPYYVKTINSIDNSITISDAYNLITGIAGPTFALSDDIGEMRVVINSGSSSVWTDPLVIHNGVKLVLGVSGYAVRTKASNNAITTNTTSGMVVGSKITFADNMFGGVLLPQTVYYIKTIVDNNEFTVSATPGGAIIALTNSTGNCYFVTNDFAFDIGYNEVGAKMVLAAQYDNSVDYIVYSIFGESEPIQYGYTIPEVQLFTGNGTTFVFNLDNYVSGLNPNNAIVEINGIRQTISQYTISGVANTLTFVEPPAPGATIAVTSFSNTERQYINTQFNLTGDIGAEFTSVIIGETVESIVGFDEVGTGFDSVILNLGELVVGVNYTINSFGTTTVAQFNIIAGTTGVAYVVGDSFTCAFDGLGYGTGTVIGPGYFDEERYYLQVANGYTTSDLFVNAPIVFSLPVLDGLNPAITYYITEILNSLQFTISTTVAGPSVILTNASGSMDAVVNGITVADITNISNIISLPITSNLITDTYVDTGTLLDNVTISGDDLTFTSYSAGGPIQLGMVITGTDFISGDSILPNTYITSGSGLNWKVSVQQSISLATAVATGYFVAANTLGFVTGQTVLFKSAYYQATELTNGKIYQIFDLGSTSQIVWNDLAGTSGLSYAVGDIFTCVDYTVGVGDGVCLIAEFGELNTLGRVYFIELYTSSYFVVSDQYGNIIEVTNENGAIQAVVGGTPAIRVTLDTSHNFDTNDLVRIDGVIGSTQLNDNTYYIHVITDTTVDLYFTPYMPGATATNNPVEYASSYVSSGYMWLDGLFTIADAITYSTSAITNRIYVNSTDNFVINTPVYFAQRGYTLGEALISGIIDGEEYYIKEVFDQETVTVDDFIPYVTYIIQDLGTTTQINWNTIAGTTGVNYEVGDIITALTTGTGTGSALTAPSFTMSIIRNGTAFSLVNDKQNTFVTQWEQMNVDRLWVTVNGYRVPSSKLRINENNNLTILATIESGDQVIITSMIPTATPNEEIYMLNVNQLNEPKVLRTNVYSKTWLTYPLYELATSIFVDDVTKVTKTVIQESVAPAPVNNMYSIGLISDKTMIASISVYNDTQNIMLEENTYYVDIVNMSPNLFITDGSYINEGDELIITVLEGNLIYINGEQIQFSSVDFENNSLSGLVRGSNGTGMQFLIPKNTEVYSMMNSNVMSTVNYDNDWNSDIYNVTEGDPLQISRTNAAVFLRSIT